MRGALAARIADEGASIGAHTAACHPPRSWRRAAIAAVALALLATCAAATAAGERGKPGPGDASRQATTARETTSQTLLLPAPGVSDEPVKAHVHLPPGYEPHGARRYPVLYVNDGQDWDAVGFDATLARLRRDGAIAPAIVVAIDMPPDRMGAYGLSDRKAGRSLVGDTRYGPVGAKADAYSRWLVERLVPQVDARYRTKRDAADRTILGWSLGALNAFNLGWQYPEVFGRVGAFSPSFWIPAARGDEASAMRTRLAQRMVDAGGKREGSRFWFAIGDSEEDDDRDHDGVNDAVDDLRDLILGYRADDGFHTRGLAELGYSVDMDAADHAPGDAEVSYFLLERGHHNQEAWKRMLPAFLAWAYPR
jgi:enterochelin esterase-like enzyme